ncbi:MAG TPA: EAL domain-containing protein [Solirubrobacteraceae bacterium]|nr:EAL domain-containing protein [Solirubrobacteraceae bacterium]
MAADHPPDRSEEARASSIRRVPGTDTLMVRAEEAAGGGSFERDLRTGQTAYSPGVCRLYGLPPDCQVTREVLLGQVHPEDRGLVEQAIEQARQDRRSFSFELRVTRRDGMERVLRSRGRVVFEGDEPAKLVGTLQDVTDEAAARSARELLSRVVESSDDAIITKTRDGRITSWNGGAERLYQYTAQEAIGQPITIIQPPDRAEEGRQILRQVFAGESLDHFETERVRKDGRRIIVSLTISPVRDSAGRIISAAVLGRDITERRQYEERLRYLADHDQLTGLFNRRRFDEELKREFARAGRYHSPGAVISIDLDNFKAINDSAGHAAGDVVLVAVAQAMRERFRETDVIARMGGDEFAVLLENVEMDGARRAAEDLLAALRAARPMYGGKVWQLQTSIGVATFQPDEATAGEVQIFADLAMYAAKRAGGDRVVTYSPEEARQVRTLARQPWSERIRDALEYDRFVLYLQPILDLASGQISHGELLLRMRDNRGKLIPPATFLPTAERAGLIHEIDRWVVRKSIGLLAGGAGSPASGGLAVNLSGASVTGDQHLLEVIESELQRTGVNPAKLIFEVTETAAIANMPEAAAFARDLTRLGCSLALDDFGTGFSSFYYLKHLPVRYIKLDGEFIQNLPRSKVDEHVVRAIVEVARSMNIKTVAESVADEATITLLRKHRVDYAQGFHIGKPNRIGGRRIRGDGADAAGVEPQGLRLVRR